MRKIKLLMLCAFAFTLAQTSLANNPPKSEMLTVEGKFLNEKALYMEVFLVQDNGEKIEIACEKTAKSFSVELKKGSRYVISFVSKSGSEKCLFVDATTAGYFQIDVDFSLPNSARLIYDSEDERYEVRRSGQKDPFYVKR